MHLKDAVLSVMDRIVADDAPVTEIWSREAFCALGSGDLDVDAILDGLRGMSLRRLAGGRAGHPAAQRGAVRARGREQRHNRAFLAARGL